MQLTPEQQAVVDIKENRHLVLAPPGSGKTEMLTQRVVSALKRGVNPDRMFCVTFTVRAGVEMRERVAAAVAADPELNGKRVPDIGNIHHFCNRMLIDNGLIPESKKVVDEIAQRELIKDVWIQLKKELQERKKRPQESADPELEQMTLALYEEEKEVEEAINVLDGFTPNKPAGMIDRDFYTGLLSLIDAIENDYSKHQRSIFPELVTAATRYHRQSRNVPYSLLRPIPESLDELRNSGILAAIARAYAKLKDRYGALDFDDLITESYLALKGERAMREENRFEWIQVDEVQDLNAIQWEIVQMVSRNDATSVFFGDAEQAIFSFMGASAERLARVASTCSTHYFKKNFRATPYLLDILVRYSLKVLRSKWLFLPQPCETAPERGELYCGHGGLQAAVTIALNWLEKGLTQDVALLVRRNFDADNLEQIIKKCPQEIRYVKVSGVEIFELNAMRDFIAFCTLLNDGGSLLSWGRMFRRFSGVKQDHIARRLVKNLVDVGLTPQQFLQSSACDIPFTNWMQARLGVIRERFSLLWNEAEGLLDQVSTYKQLFDLFDGVCWQGKLFELQDYVSREEISQYETEESQRQGHKVTMPLHEARKRFLLRTEKLFRYFEKKREKSIAANPGYAQKTLREVMKIEWREVLQLREADLIVGDEQLVISTIHKAKGRQFGGVVIPYCQAGVFPSARAKTQKEIDEEARILYVGLSRAKRHLALCYTGTPSPFIKCIQPCFGNGFLNFFRRKILGEKICEQMPSTDWLSTYNELLDAGSASLCPQEKVKAILENAHSNEDDPILRRIAISTIRWTNDTEWRDACYRSVLKDLPRSLEDGDIAKEVLKGIGTLRLTSFVEDNSIRTLFLYSVYSSVKDEVHFAILNCYDALLERHEITLDNVFGNKPIDELTDSFREKLKEGIEDALFSDNGDVRMEAYRLLKENFDVTPGLTLDGSDNDWCKLRGFLSGQRCRVLKWMLRNNRYSLPQGKWRDQIQELLLLGNRQGKSE